MNKFTTLIINTKTGRGVSKSRRCHLRRISVLNKCLRHGRRHAIVSRFQIRNAVRTWWYELLSSLQRFVIQKPPLWNREIIRTPLSQWASFLLEKQDVTQVLNSCLTCPIAWSYIAANIHDYNWAEMFCERMLLLSAVLGLLFVLQCPSTSGKRVKYLHSHTEYINFT